MLTNIYFFRILYFFFFLNAPSKKTQGDFPIAIIAAKLLSYKIAAANKQKCIS